MTGIYDENRRTFLSGRGMGIGVQTLAGSATREEAVAARNEILARRQAAHNEMIAQRRDDSGMGAPRGSPPSGNAVWIPAGPSGFWGTQEQANRARGGPFAYAGAAPLRTIAGG